MRFAVFTINMFTDFDVLFTKDFAIYALAYFLVFPSFERLKLLIVSRMLLNPVSTGPSTCLHDYPPPTFPRHHPRSCPTPACRHVPATPVAAPSRYVVTSPATSVAAPSVYDLTDLCYQFCRCEPPKGLPVLLE